MFKYYINIICDQRSSCSIKFSQYRATLLDGLKNNF